MPSWVVGCSEKQLSSFSKSLIGTCRLGQTSTVTLQRQILYILFAGSILMRQGIWGLLSLKLDNVTHKYSFHYSCFYIWITKRINAQMPWALQGSREKRWECLGCKSGFQPVLQIMRGWQNLRILKRPLFFYPPNSLTTRTLCFHSTFFFLLLT